MRQRRLHAVHLIDNDLLEFATGRVHDCSERKLRQLGKQLLSDGFENAERRLVGDGQRTVIQRSAEQIPAQCRRKPWRIDAERRFACQQQRNDPLRPTPRFAGPGFSLSYRIPRFITEL